MKTTISLLTLMLIIGLSGCQTQLDHPVVTLDTPAPMAYTINSSFSRIVVVRLKNGTDLLEGLQKAVEKENIKNAVILSGIGSLTDYHVHTVGNRTFPPKSVFMKDDVPTDLLNVTGYIVDGRVHCHITFTTEKKALGGHLEPETKAFTFAIITLGVFEEGTSLDRVDDYTWH
jgi:predicted DNA-binding protein with PD1-like motif